MGRLGGLLAGLVAAARLVADALLIWRDVRRDLAQADPLGAPDLGGAPEARPPDRPGGVGPAGPQTGAAAGEERAGTDGAVTRG